MADKTYSTPIPGAASQAQAELIAKQAYQQALAQINAQRMGTLRQYGYKGTIDPSTGTMSHMTVDPNNPYGQYQQDRQQHAYAMEANQAIGQERGLSGGLAQDLIKKLHNQFGSDNAQLGQNLTGALSGLQQNQDTAKYQYDSALYSAQAQAARDAIAAQQFNQADYSGMQLPAYGETPVEQGTVPPDTPASPGYSPPKTGGTVYWDGRNMNRNQLVRNLVARGVAPSTWAKGHPAAARLLGVSRKVGANTALIKKAKAGRR